MTSFQLRPYQARIAKLTTDYLREYPNARPIIVAPCGAGKSLLISKLVIDLLKTTSGAILILSHRKEILEQNAAKLPEHLVGIFSAGLGKKDMTKRVVVASMQSIRNHVTKLPRVSAIILDECHVAGMAYREMIETILKKSPDARIIGYTGTPYLGDANRTALHLLTPDKRIFTGVGGEITIGELLRDGYLCPLTPYQPPTLLSTEGVKVDSRTGDFAQGALQAAVDADDLNAKVVGEMRHIIHTAARRHTLVFCAGVQHAEHIRDLLRAAGECAEMILGSTPGGERDSLIARFRAGKLPWLVSVEAMTTGFDAPVADSIVMLRPTFSAVLWLQMLGRIQRPHPSKQDGLVIDFTENSKTTFPPIDEIEANPPRLKTGDAPTKICPECFSICLAGLRLCPTCDFEFPPPEAGAAQQFDPNTGLLISGVQKNDDGSKTYPVSDVTYEIRTTSAGAPALVAKYMSPGRATPVATEFLNLFHHNSNVANREAARWLRRQKFEGGSVPVTAQEALTRAEMGALRVPKSVTVKPGSPWPVRFQA